MVIKELREPVGAGAWWEVLGHWLVLLSEGNTDVLEGGLGSEML